MKPETTHCKSETEEFHDCYDSIYADYANQPYGDLDDYIFNTEIEQKKHSEK